jgi:uncharacterized membrane protein YheB (UPF0754 family)
MLLLRAFLFILLNVSLGYILVSIIRIILFYPAEAKFIGDKKMPFTPALVYSLKKQIIRKLYNRLHDFIRECEDFTDASRITKYEKMVYNRIEESLTSLDKIRYLPGFIAKEIKSICAQIGLEFSRHFIRSFIPFLMEKYNVESYIELLNQKLEIAVLKEYYDRYVHRYLLYLVLSFFFLTGIFNMLIYLIIR